MASGTQDLKMFVRDGGGDRKSTRLNSSHLVISYAVFCLKKKIHAATILGGDNMRAVLVVKQVVYVQIVHTPVDIPLILVCGAIYHVSIASAHVRIHAEMT